LRTLKSKLADFERDAQIQPPSSEEAQEAEHDGDTTEQVPAPSAFPVDLQALLVDCGPITVNLHAPGLSDKWKMQRQQLLARLQRRLGGVDAAIKSLTEHVEPKRRGISAQAEVVVMHNALSRVRDVIGKTMVSMEHSRKLEATVHKQRCKQLWKSSACASWDAPILEDADVSAGMGISGLCRLPDIVEPPTATALRQPVYQMQPGVVDLGSDSEDEIPKIHDGTHAKQEKREILDALSRLQEAYELRDAALKNIIKRAVEEERAKVTAVLERKRQYAFEKVASMQHRKQLCHTLPNEEASAVYTEANAALLSDHLPDLLREMVSVASGISARSTSGNAASKGTKRADMSIMTDLLATAVEPRQAQTVRAQVPGGTAFSKLAVRNNLKQQLSAAQVRLTSHEDARKRGFQNIVQLGVQRARRALKLQYESQAALLTERLGSKDSSADAGADSHMATSAQLDFSDSSGEEESVLDTKLPTSQSHTQEAVNENTQLSRYSFPESDSYREVPESRAAPESVPGDLVDEGAEAGGSNEAKIDALLASNSPSAIEDEEEELARVLQDSDEESDVSDIDNTSNTGQGFTRLRKVAAAGNQTDSEEDVDEGATVVKRSNAIAADEDDEVSMQIAAAQQAAARTAAKLLKKKKGMTYVDILRADAEAVHNERKVRRLDMVIVRRHQS
jgi:hypothetical protein